MLLCCLLVWGILPQTSSAIVYKGHPGTVFTLPREGLSAWDNIGEMSIGAGIYLGDGWVLTPYHVYRYTHPEGSDDLSYLDLDTRYHEIPGTARRIEHSATADADLMMFRINGNPVLELIEITRVSPSTKEVTIVATGRLRSGSEEVDWPGGYTGFETVTTRGKRWGENWTSLSTTMVNSFWGSTRSFTTTFDLHGPYGEAQPVDKDSGGGAFVKKGQDWELAGLVLAIGTPNGYSGPDPRYNAVYGNGAFYANLATYHPQIEEIRLIPLPGDADWDGDVDITDFAILRSTLGDVGPGLSADFNGDEVVDFTDVEILETNFGMISGSGIPGAGGSAPPAMTPVPAPGPATFFMLAAAGPLLLRSRSRRRRT